MRFVFTRLPLFRITTKRFNNVAIHRGYEVLKYLLYLHS